MTVLLANMTFLDCYINGLSSTGHHTKHCAKLFILPIPVGVLCSCESIVDQQGGGICMCDPLSKNPSATLS